MATRPKPKDRQSPFVQLDYLYTPTRDVAADARYFSEVLGGRLAFAVEGIGARVAKVELTDGPPHILLTDHLEGDRPVFILTDGPPHILLTDHLEGDRPVFIYRVDDLDVAMSELKKRGWKKKSTLEIPMGPCCSFTLPAGHRIAIYELTRPDVAKHFDGRFDF